MIRFIVNQVLTLNGHNVIDAGTWTEGTERLRTECFDLIVSDLLMPSPGSLTFIRAKREEFPDLPLIVMSGVLDPANYFGAAESMGANGTLSKPFTSRELIEAVDKALVHELVPSTELLPLV